MAEEIIVLKRPKEKKVKKKEKFKDYIELPLKKPVSIRNPVVKRKQLKPETSSFLKLGDVDEQAVDSLNAIVKQFKRELDERVNQKEFLLNKKLQAQMEKNDIALKKAKARLAKEYEQKLKLMEQTKIREKVEREFNKRLRESLKEKKAILDDKNNETLRKLESELRKSLESELERRHASLNKSSDERLSAELEKLRKSFSDMEKKLRQELDSTLKVKKEEMDKTLKKEKGEFDSTLKAKKEEMDKTLKKEKGEFDSTLKANKEETDRILKTKKEELDKLFDKRVREELDHKVNVQFDKRLSAALAQALKQKEKELRHKLDLEYEKKLFNAEAKLKKDYQLGLEKEKVRFDSEIESREAGLDLIKQETENQYKDKISELEVERENMDEVLAKKRQELEKEYQGRAAELNVLAQKLKDKEAHFDEYTKKKLEDKKMDLLKEFDNIIKKRYDEIENVINTLRDKMDEDMKQEITSEFEKVKEKVKQEMTVYSQQLKEEKKKSWFKF